MNPLLPGGDIWNYAAIMSFVFGLIWGSFFNVCIYRVPVKKSVVKPASHCYHCGSFLDWYDNIPLLSYLLLRGRCRSCGTSFSIRYFLVELLTGFMFLGLFLRFGIHWAVPFHIVFSSLLLVGIFTDIDHFILPDGITIGGTIYAIIATAVLGQFSVVYDELLLAQDILAGFFSDMPLLPRNLNPHVAALGYSLLSAGFGYGLLWSVGALGQLIFRKHAMGGGDIKLFAGLGAYLGALNCIWILFLASLLGSVIGLTIIGVFKLVARDQYDEISLDPARAVKCHFPVVESQLPAESTPPEQTTAESSTGPATGVITLRILRTTLGKTQIPFGPYIAMAAFIILLFHREVNAFARQFFYLPLQ